MERQLLVVKPANEKRFVQDFLVFASKKYHSKPTIGWTSHIEHISDPTIWIDLYQVAKYTGQNALTWHESDAWSFSWDRPTANGFVHTTSQRKRRQLARKIELYDFDPMLAEKAINFDLMIFINDTYAAIALDWLRSNPLTNCENFALYVLSHEVLHYVQDWTGKQLVMDEVPPWLDEQVSNSLDEFVIRSGGWTEIERRYLT